MKKSLLFLLTLSSLRLLAGCGSANSAPSLPPPAVATHFSVSSPAAETAGTPFNITVTAFDATNNVVASYSASLHFTSTDPQAVLPANSPLTNGTGAFSITLKTASAQTISVSATGSAAISGTSNSINVTAPAATHFSVVTPANGTAGTSFTFSVNAVDTSNKVVGSYAGTVHFTSTDAQSVLPANSTLTSGTGSFSATLKTTGNQTITATDAVTPSIAGTSNSISVSNNQGASLSITSGTPPGGTVGILYDPSQGPPCTPGSYRCFCVYLGPLGYSCHISLYGFPLAATGGVPPLAWTWAAAPASFSPPGLTIESVYSRGSTRCCVSVTGIGGIPTTAGTYNVIVTVSDSASPPAHASASYTVVISSPSPTAASAMVANSAPAQHHHYKLIQMGTFGGPTSTLDTPGNPPLYPFNRVLNNAGAVLGSADTPIPDPFCIAGCQVNYAFRWQDGVQTNLGVLPQNPTVGAQTPCFDCAWSVFVYWIADNGLVVGQASVGNALDPLTGSPALLAVLWKDGNIVNLGTLGGNESTAGAVNSGGDVVGAALNLTTDPFPFRPPYKDFFFLGNGTESHAVLWRDGTMLDLGTLGGPDSAAFLLNQNGQVAGASDVDFNVNPVTGGPTIHPFLWQNGKMLDLVAGAPAGMFGGTYGIAAWLNERGQVLGTMNLAGDTTWHSFLWDKGVVADLGTLGGINTTAQWLTNDGHVSGKSDVTAICTACAPDNQKQLHHPFVWKDGVMTDLGLLYSDTAGAAYSVNARDQAVGVTVPCTTVNADDSCEGPVYHAFLWENGSMVELQTLVLPGSGITLSCPKCGEAAYNINDRGEIAGQGVLSDGNFRAVLLIPCDENHPNVQGCDYSLVNPAAVQSSATPIPTANVAATPANLTASETDRVRALRTRRNRRFGVPAPK
jgi:probable HAF family extracellular repeat protein